MSECKYSNFQFRIVLPTRQVVNAGLGGLPLIADQYLSYKSVL